MTEYEKLHAILLEMDKECHYRLDGWEQRVEAVESMLPHWMSHRKETHQHLLLNGKQWPKNEELAKYIQEKSES